MKYKELVNKYGIKHTYLAKKMGVAKATLFNLLTGRKYTETNKLRLEHELKVLATNLLKELDRKS